MHENAQAEKKQKHVKNETPLADLLLFLMVIIYMP